MEVSGYFQKQNKKVPSLYRDIHPGDSWPYILYNKQSAEYIPHCRVYTLNWTLSSTLNCSRQIRPPPFWRRVPSCKQPGLHRSRSIKLPWRNLLTPSVYIKSWCGAALPPPVSSYSVKASTVENGSNISNRPVWISCAYTTSFQSWVKWMDIFGSSQFPLYRDLPLYKVHQFGRAVAGEPTLLE